MDSTIRFSALNRSIHVLPRRSNCSLGLFIGRIKKSAIPGMGCESIDVSTTSADIAKWKPPFNSAHQICLSTSSEDVLIVVGGLSSVESKKPKSDPIFTISPQLVPRLQNGQHGWIQRIKYGYPRPN